jgi:hypothetical protein
MQTSLLAPQMNFARMGSNALFEIEVYIYVVGGLEDFFPYIGTKHPN